MKKFLLTALALVSASGNLWAIRWPFDEIPLTTSDFGPRMRPVIGTNPDGRPKLGSGFHLGIDMQPAHVSASQFPGFPIKAVAVGTIPQDGGIRLVNDKIWVLTIESIIDGQPRHFDYLHIFKNGQPAPGRPLPSPRGLFEMRVSTTGIFFIIRNATGTVTAKAFTSNPTPIPVPGRPDLIATNQVEEGEIIAPMGNSGSRAFHLHLGLNMAPNLTTGKNPFLFLTLHSIRTPDSVAPGGFRSFDNDDTLFYSRREPSFLSGAQLCPIFKKGVAA